MVVKDTHRLVVVEGGDAEVDAVRAVVDIEERRRRESMPKSMQSSRLSGVDAEVYALTQAT
jgi:hypothetical protein